MPDSRTTTEATLQEVARHLHACGVSLIGALQFLRAQPVLDARDRLRLAQIVTAPYTNGGITHTDNWRQRV